MCSAAVKDKNILICATGSVAAIKIPEIIAVIKEQFKANVELKFVPTAKALHFLPGFNEEKETELGIKIFKDEDEWSSWNERGDPVLHIELRKWADILVLGSIKSVLSKNNIYLKWGTV